MNLGYILKIEGNLLDNDKIILSGYSNIIEKYFTTTINKIEYDNTIKNESEAKIVLPYEDYLYTISTEVVDNDMDNWYSTLNHTFNTFNYCTYNIPNNVYMSFIGSLVTTL